MVSFITSSNHLVNAHHLISPDVSSIGLRTNFKIRQRFGLVLLKKDCSFGFTELRGSRKSRTTSGFLCKGSSEREAELALERELFEFMTNSRKPNEFPTKKELMDAGRVDLVNAIVKRGGWLSLGWDSDVEDDEDENGSENDSDIRDLQGRPESLLLSNGHDPSVSPISSESASPSGRSLEVAEEDTGIEGILSRLERHRNWSFGINAGQKGSGTSTSTKDDVGRTCFDTSPVVGDSDMQRTWSVQPMCFSDKEFEAAEICYSKNEEKGEEDDAKNKIFSTQADAEISERPKEINSNQIKFRLQHLQLELSSALHTLRSKSETLDEEVGKISSDLLFQDTLQLKDPESKSTDLQQLSDVWEFQENEFMNAQDKLRSLRAKLAVLEGKMALSIIDAQKILEEKQRRIDSARRTLQLLRTTCIIWHNSASEVLLAGSFDGWTTQRKMEKSRTGIFSVSLKLYPGSYQIKFIVDGVWRVDPLRPIVNNSGYENNILIVT